MTDRALQYRRAHNLLLIQKLLAVRGAASPFTLVLDSVEQSAKTLVAHYIENAKVSKADIMYISYETPKPPTGITTFIKARRKDPLAVQREITSNLSSGKNTLLILDTLHPLLTTTPTLNLSSFLSTLLTPQTTLLAIHHTDIPLPPPPTPYAPPPLTLLRYLATTILTTHSLSQTLACKRAAEKSLAEPTFGLAEERDGVVIGKGANDTRGCVVQMEYRRKSGRGVEETFCFPPVGSKGKIVLLDDHRRAEDGGGVGEGGGVGGVEGSTTFDLGLTAKQRRDREGVVLPYLDAQKGGGGGEGGRILYDMGVEDDFDEEEDEF